MNKLDYISIKDNGIPKYQQIINSITQAIDEGELKINDKLPSINALMRNFSLSQDTVLNAYNHLKSKGLISSAIGKGYFILKENTIENHHVFVLFDNFTFYKEKLYNSINQAFDGNGTIDIYFHHNNHTQYKKLINDSIGNYTSYIIMSIEDARLDEFVIKTLPSRSTYMLDIASDKLKRKFPFVGQNFEDDVRNCLGSQLSLIQKYSKIRFLNSSAKPHILKIKKGIMSFGKNNGFFFDFISDLNKTKIKKGDLFFVIKDHDLIKLIEKTNAEKLKIGEDIGIISYNETDLKKVIHNGISTISTDFDLMGQTIAQLVISKSRKRIFNQAIFTVRNSI